MKEANVMDLKIGTKFVANNEMYEVIKQDYDITTARLLTGKSEDLYCFIGNIVFVNDKDCPNYPLKKGKIIVH